MAQSDDPAHREGRYDRRELLRRAGAGAVGVGIAGSGFGQAFYGPLRFKGRWLKGDLSLITWVHFVPSFDEWLDKTWAVRWGQRNDVEVKIDHVLNTLLLARAQSESAAKSGHDIFFDLAPRPQFEDQVINHKEIIQEVQRKIGKIGRIAHKATYNPRTKKYFAFSDNYVPDPVVWRRDLWNEVGHSPSTWDQVRRAAPKLKAAGHPLGIGMSQEIDSNMALQSFMMCFGSFVQNSKHQVTIKSKRTVEALNFMADIYQRGMTDEVFGWDPAGNNNYLYSGKGSMIFNAISATRTPEDRNLPFAKDLWLWPVPKGPHGRMGYEHVMGVWWIWKFARNKAAAKKFLADLEINYDDAFMASKFYNFPSFPGAMPFKRVRRVVAQDKHRPLGKYSILATIAQRYTTNPGHPGFTNAAYGEVFAKFIIPTMFAQVAQKRMSAQEAVNAADREMKAIYRKWRRLKKI